jgi:hypothetical protein
MKTPLFSVALTALFGCGRVGIADKQLGDAAAGSANRADTGTGLGGRGGASATGDPTCTATALTTAPLPCAVGDWSHAQGTYKKTCKASRGGYQARCPSNDAIAFTGDGGETWCFYGTSTGQLVGSLVRNTKGEDCKSFDLNFAAPDTSTCAPVSGAECGADGGP